MTLHAKMEALRKAHKDYSDVPGDPLDDAVCSAMAGVLREYFDRPASERAQEWRQRLEAAMDSERKESNELARRGATWETVDTEPMFRAQELVSDILDEAERAITNMGAAGDQGEVERLRKEVAQMHEEFRRLLDGRSHQRIEDPTYVGELERQIVDLQFHADQKNDALAKLEEARSVIDKLMDRLAQKGASK